MKWKIGNVEIANQVVLAPMAGICDSAFRRIVKSMGCGLIETEMVSTRAVMYLNRKTQEMLTMTENQTLVYRPITLSANGLYGKYTDFDLTHNLVFRVGKNLPQAGTYRLNMKWSYEGICFAKTQTTFFINYAA